MNPKNKYTPDARLAFTKFRSRYNNIVAITGHRPDKLYGYGWENHVKLVNFYKQHFKNRKVDLLVCGGALGADTAAASAACSMGIPFLLALPFASMGSNWPDRTSLEKSKKAAIAVVDVCGDPFEAWKYNARNEFMVDICDRVVSLWDGSRGGTGNCVAYANKVAKPPENLWAEFAKLL